MSIPNYDQEIERRYHPENFEEDYDDNCPVCGEPLHITIITLYCHKKNQEGKKHKKYTVWFYPEEVELPK